MVVIPKKKKIELQKIRKGNKLIKNNQEKKPTEGISLVRVTVIICIYQGRS